MDKDYLQPEDAPVSDKKEEIIKRMDRINPYGPPVFISKGTVETTLGGRTTFKDANGGTLLTYDPDTGTITIYGGIVSQQNVNIGTLSNSTFAGTINNTQVINGGTITNDTFRTGSVFNTYMGTGTIASPAMTGTMTLDILGGSAKLANNGNFALQSFGTAGVLAWRVGGTTFYVSPTGTIA